MLAWNSWGAIRGAGHGRGVALMPAQSVLIRLHQVCRRNTGPGGERDASARDLGGWLQGDGREGPPTFPDPSLLRSKCLISCWWRGAKSVTSRAQANTRCGWTERQKKKTLYLGAKQEHTRDLGSYAEIKQRSVLSEKGRKLPHETNCGLRAELQGSGRQLTSHLSPGAQSLPEMKT